MDCISGVRRSFKSSLRPDVETPTILARVCRSTSLMSSMSTSCNSAATAGSRYCETGVDMWV